MTRSSISTLQLRPKCSSATALRFLLVPLILSMGCLCFAQITLPASGDINTIAGTPETLGCSGSGGAATSADFGQPIAVAVDSSGNVYIADAYCKVVWEAFASTGDISIIAGNGTTGYTGDGGPATSAEIGNLFAITVDSSGNVYIADLVDSVIREVLASTGYIYTVAGGGAYPFCAGATDNRGDGCAATEAELDNPQGIAVDASGNLYIADSGDAVIREVAGGTISVVAGNLTHGYSGDGGPATEAEFNAPVSVSFDSHGNMYVADANVDVVREISASTGYISTIAGTGTGGYSGDGGAATSAKLNTPGSAAVDSSGNVYITDSNNCRIRLVTYSSGDISTFAGTGRETYSGDGGSASDASIGLAYDSVLDSSGNLYIADSTNYVIRAVGN